MYGSSISEAGEFGLYEQKKLHTNVQFRPFFFTLLPPSLFKIKDWTSTLMYVSRSTVSPISKLALSEVVYIQSGMLNGHMTWLNWLVTVICNGA